jgi:hypothetical protein
MLAYHCTISLAYTYALRRPELARELAREAFSAAIDQHRPDLAYRANELLCALGVN